MRSGRAAGSGRPADCAPRAVPGALGSWLPGYLDAIADLATPVLPGWAELTRTAIAAESAGRNAGGPLPLALRAAPPPLTSDCGLGEMLDALVAPVRSGLIITRRRLARGAGHAGAGHRIGECRFTLRAMLEQAPAATLGWLRDEARLWSRRHAARAASDVAAGWWAARAGHSARVLAAAAAAAGEKTGAARGRWPPAAGRHHRSADPATDAIVAAFASACPDPLVLTSGPRGPNGVHPQIGYRCITWHMTRQAVPAPHSGFLCHAELP